MERLQLDKPQTRTANLSGKISRNNRHRKKTIIQTINNSKLKTMAKQKTKAELIEAQMKEHTKTLIKHGVYPLAIVGLTFKLDENGAPNLKSGQTTVIKEPNVKNGLMLTMLTQAAAPLRAELVKQSQKNNLKKVD